MKYQFVVIGASLGGLQALRTVLSALPATFRLPVAVAQHRLADAGDPLHFVLQACCALPVQETEDKQAVESGRVYLVPGGYHLLVEDNHFALTTEEPALFAQPSIDALFETAATSFGPRLIGVVLTGSGRDGAAGLAAVSRVGGRALIESPSTAFAGEMPAAAKLAVPSADVLALEEIGPALCELSLMHEGGP